MNNIQLKDKIRNLSKSKNVDFNTLLRIYMYDRFIERLSISKYKDNFILKGGFYLSTLFGIENRTTMDIDTAFRKANFEEETIEKMIKEILSIKLDDNAKLNYIGISPIRNEDEYGGFRVDIQIEIDSIKEKIHIDIATGDPITPKEISYEYKPILSDKCIKIWAYNIETVVAEKIETIISRLELNGRMRDFYDIYLIYTKEWININQDYLKKATEKTFLKRGYKGNPSIALQIIKNNIILKARWEKYRKKYEYAKDIEFSDIVRCIEEILNIVIGEEK